MHRLIILLPAVGLGMVAFAVARILAAPPVVASVAAALVGITIAGLPLWRAFRQGHTSRVRLDDLALDEPEPVERRAAAPAPRPPSKPEPLATEEEAYGIGRLDLARGAPFGSADGHCFLMPLAVQRLRGATGKIGSPPDYGDLGAGEREGVDWIYRAMMRQEEAPASEGALHVQTRLLAAHARENLGRAYSIAELDGEEMRETVEAACRIVEGFSKGVEAKAGEAKADAEPSAADAPADPGTAPAGPPAPAAPEPEASAAPEPEASAAPEEPGKPKDGVGAEPAADEAADAPKPAQASGPPAGAPAAPAAAADAAAAGDDAGEPEIERSILDPATYIWLGSEPDPELWHLILWSLKWDEGPDPVFCTWVVSQPECDRATAADLFLALSGPDLVGLTDDEIRERFATAGEYVDVVKRICYRCQEEGFPVSRFRPNFLDWQDADLPKWREDLKRSDPGPDQPGRLRAPVSLLERDFPTRRPKSDHDVKGGVITRRRG